MEEYNSLKVNNERHSKSKDYYYYSKYKKLKEKFKTLASDIIRDKSVASVSHAMGDQLESI
jgi:hypothetical protein